MKSEASKVKYGKFENPMPDAQRWKLFAYSGSGMHLVHIASDLKVLINEKF